MTQKQFVHLPGGAALNKIKMIATDIDGTILKWDYQFSPEVKKCIKKMCERNIKVVLVTGRMHRAALGVSEELGLNTPIVSYQGALVKDNTGKTLYQKDLSPETACQIIKWAKDNNVHINLYMDDVLYVENDNETVRQYTDARFIDYKVCKFDDLEIKNVKKILAIKYGDADTVTKWVKYLRKEYPELYIVKSTPYFCEIADKQATKGLAVDFLCKQYGISKDEVLAIGDQDNDIELLKSGGIAVAMGNATEDLKKCANFITDTVDNDGWVKAIEKYCI